MEQVVTFGNSGKTLYGVLHLPEPGGSRPHGGLGVLLLHAGRQARRGPHNLYVKVARALCRAGFPVFRYDNRGYGDSEGPETVGVADWIADAHRALAFFRDAGGVDRVIVWGLCAGSVMAVHCAAEAPSAADSLFLCNLIYKTNVGTGIGFRSVYGKLLTIAFWREFLTASPLYYLKKGVPNVLRRLRAVLFPTAQEDEFGKASHRYIRALPERLAAAGCPTCFLFSTADPLVGRPLEELFGNPVWQRALAKVSTELSLLDGADHNFSSLEFEAAAIDRTVAWALQRAAARAAA
ncbi:MAG: alpha/beta fold hydrolase [Deltaproteobacteria bacterium]|nr:alpha/beta fold hydrolase [Deltaproteobacteria bacterium]